VPVVVQRIGGHGVELALAVAEGGVINGINEWYADGFVFGEAVFVFSPVINF